MNLSPNCSRLLVRLWMHQSTCFPLGYPSGISRPYTYFPPRLERKVTLPSASTLHENGEFGDSGEILSRLISNVDSPNSLGRSETQYLVFAVSDIQLNPGDNLKDVNNDLPYTLLPPELTSRIREPLAFLSHRRFLFLDTDQCICTWRFPPSSVPTRSQGGRNSGKSLEVGNTGIEQFYFLPGDWVTSSESKLCVIMSDGTLLCPKNGAVATVESAKLRE